MNLFTIHYQLITYIIHCFFPLREWNKCIVSAHTACQSKPSTAIRLKKYEKIEKKENITGEKICGSNRDIFSHTKILEHVTATGGITFVNTTKHEFHRETTATIGNIVGKLFYQI